RGHQAHPRSRNWQGEVARRIRRQERLLIDARRRAGDVRMRRLALGLAWSLAFALAQTPLAAVAQTTPSSPPVATAQFDYYVMTLSWAPGFCDLGGKETSSPECAEGSGDGFVVHGLWPNNEYRPNPESCRGEEATSADLDDEHGVYPNDRLAAYEYRKHG